MKYFLMAAVALLIGCSEMSSQIIYHQNKTDVVRLLSPIRRSGGTGFVVNIKNNHYIVTNRHVCELAENGVIIAEQDGVRTYVEVIRYTMKHDLCLVSSPKKVGGFKISRHDSRRGDKVSVLGHPHLGPLQYTEGYRIGEELTTLAYEGGSLYEGTSGCSKSEYTYHQTPFYWYCTQTLHSYQMNAYSAPGSSGSPVLNVKGEVVGVVFAGDNSTNIGLYVPLFELREFLGLEK